MAITEAVICTYLLYNLREKKYKDYMLSLFYHYLPTKLQHIDEYLLFLKIIFPKPYGCNFKTVISGFVPNLIGIPNVPLPCET